MTNSIGEKISVCLLTYNHVDVIESTLRSVLDQSISGYEVVVSDDCSTDGTWECILELASEDGRIRPVRTPRNMGMPGNANFAVAQCERPFIALLHHDDLYRRDLLEKWTGVLDRHPDVAFVFNPYGVFESEVVYEDPMPGERIDGTWFLERRLLARWGCVVRGTAMIRRGAWDRAGGMRAQFGLLADVDMWMRLARQWAVGYVPEALVIVRQQRPDDYPEIYKDVDISWKRLRYLYEIHGTNLRAYLESKTSAGGAAWFMFRLRLSLDSAKWLCYGVVRRRPAVIASSYEGATAYDLWPLRLFRWLLTTIYA